MNEPTNSTVSGLKMGLTGAVGITKAALHVDRADEVVIRKRRSLCAACPNAQAGSSETSRCVICSCFIWPKTATASEKCPIGEMVRRTADNWIVDSGQQCHRGKMFRDDTKRLPAATANAHRPSGGDDKCIF